MGEYGNKSIPNQLTFIYIYTNINSFQFNQQRK